MSALPASFKVRRYERDPSLFLVSLDDFHYEGEGQLVTRDALDGLFGSVVASALIDQLDAANTHTEEAA